jgi:hypothetical protein
MHRLDHAVSVLAIGLEGATGIDQKVGPQRHQRMSKITVAIEHRRFQPCRRLLPRAERLGALRRTAGDDQLQPWLVLQQLDDAATEDAVAADDQHTQRHARNHSTFGGTGR